MRNRITQALDTPASFIGDVGLVGVNMRLDPSMVPAGYASEAVNMRFRNGIAETRKGFVKLPWLNKISTTTVTITSLTRSGSTATAVTASNHGLAESSIAVISGATQTEYNGAFIVSVTNATTFSYGITGTPATPATGTPVLKKFNQQPWGTVYGTGLFSDPETLADYLLIAADGNVYASVDNQEPFTVTLPAGVSITSVVTFRQAFDTVVMFRGEDLAPLAMSSIVVGFKAISETPTTITRSGTTATVTTPQAHGYFSGDTVAVSGADQQAYNGDQTITVTSDTTFTYTVSGSPTTPATGDIRIDSDGTEPIPNATRGLYIANRLVIPHEGDEIAVSDVNSYTKYLPVVSEFRINAGSSDSLVTIEKFNDTTVVAFKGHSIYALSNFYGDLSQLQLDEITDKFGLVAADSVAHCGSDLLFLSQMGVMSIRQTEQQKLQDVTVPLSEPIQPLIDRIRWTYAANAQSAYWDSKYYLAVPLDDAEILGPELVSATYPPGPPFSVQITVNNLVSGGTYRFEKGTNEVSLTNGTQTLTTSGTFTAQGTSVVITGTAFSATVTASLKRVHVGVNNAILVYDFLNNAWSGYDEADGFSIKKFFVRRYQGVDRLFVVTHEGWVVMYEDDFEDQLMVPYTDVVVSAIPVAGNLCCVNGGTVASGLAIPNNISPTTWGIGSPASVSAAGTNLWADGAGVGGYSNSASIPWTAANTIAVKITNGVRFYATNGILPIVFTTGNWATITETVVQEINSRLTTRAYTPDGGESLSDFDWLCLDIDTWHPDYSLELITDGPFETTTIDSSITKSRTRYTIFGRADWDGTNANFDFSTNHREDYSLSVGGSPGGVFDLGSTSVDIQRHQQFREEFKVRKRGRAARVKINNSQGRFRLQSCKLENRKSQTKAGAKT